MFENIDFKDYRKKSDIHGTCLYPATMIAPMQNLILDEMINKNKCVSIFDPFHGSGTALYESKVISADITVYGCDINPLANLITKVKLDGIDPDNIIQDILILKNNYYNLNYKIHHFNNIEKWFKEDIISELSKIRNAIINVTNPKNRRFFWYMFIDIIRLYSNTRSSTYKLHIKEEKQIENLDSNKIFDEYINTINNSLDFFRNSFCNYELYKSDILNKISDFEDNKFDLIITSPPYGDNATTVPYGQFSSLALMWLDVNDLELDGWELDNYSKIDNASLGGKKRIPEFDVFELSLLIPYLNQISNSKKEKVINFFDDYFFFLKQLCRVTNQYIVMTLGNRTVDGININLTDITKKYLEYNNFINIELGKRKILQKRMPYRTSTVNNKSVESINHEYVIIHEKQNLKFC